VTAVFGIACKLGKTVLNFASEKLKYFRKAAWEGLNIFLQKKYNLENVPLAKVTLFYVCTISPLSPPKSVFPLAQVHHL